LGHSHSICIFEADWPKRDYWRAPVYKKITQYISDGYAVIYILESDAITTIRHMSKMGIEVEDYVESGALTIISNDVFYSPHVASPILIEQWQKLFSNIEKKYGKPKGFVAIGMPTSSFFTSLSYQEHLVEYESTVAEKYDGSLLYNEVDELYASQAYHRTFKCSPKYCASGPCVEPMDQF
jgi:hypothetical protein